MPPVGLTPFSVGDGGAALVGDVVVVVVVVVDVDGPLLPLPQAVARPPTAIRAAPAATATLNRLSLTVVTMLVLFVRSQLFRWTPGGSVGAGGALISGVNRLPPVGLMPFSVGDGGVALVGVVVVVVVDVEGAWPPLLPHPAVNAPITIRAPQPAAAIRRRINTLELMMTKLV